MSESGLALQSELLDQSTIDAGKQLASYLGCPTTNTETIIECLRAVPANDLIKYQMAMTDTGGGVNKFSFLEI